MLRRARLTTALITIVMLLAGYDVASAATASRIELRDSTVFKHVSYSIDKNYKVVVIEIDGEKKNISFIDITKILNGRGKDITAKVLGGHFLPAGTTAQVLESFEPSREGSGRRKFPFSVGFRLGTDFSSPSGDWYYGTRSGIGIGCDLLIAVGQRLAIRGTISKSGVRHDVKELFAGGLVFDDDLSWKVWRYFVSLQTFQWKRRGANRRTIPYGCVGLGFVSHSLSGRAIVGDPDTGEVWEYIGSGRSNSKLAITIGTGLITMISRKVGIDLGVALDIVKTGAANEYAYGWSSPESVYAYLFDLRVGLVVLGQ